MDEATDLANRIRAIPGVYSANAWSKYDKVRVYVETENLNGKATGPGGKFYVDVKRGTIEDLARAGWTGARTRNAAHEVVVQIQAMLKPQGASSTPTPMDAPVPAPAATDTPEVPTVCTTGTAVIPDGTALEVPRPVRGVRQPADLRTPRAGAGWRYAPVHEVFKNALVDGVPVQHVDHTGWLHLKDGTQVNPLAIGDRPVTLTQAGAAYAAKLRT